MTSPDPTNTKGVSMKMPVAGGCQCGAVRYEISARPLQLYVCHCRECRHQSASAFGISAIFPRHALRLIQGETRTWTRPTDSGRVLDCVFCVLCGSRLWHATRDEDVLSIKGGSLDEPVDLTGAIHIWTSRKLAGVVVPNNAIQYAEEPP
jgi:hypothetical protein